MIKQFISLSLMIAMSLGFIASVSGETDAKARKAISDIQKGNRGPNEIQTLYVSDSVKIDGAATIDGAVTIGGTATISGLLTAASTVFEGARQYTVNTQGAVTNLIGDLLHVVGYTNGYLMVEKADASASKPAHLIATQSKTNGSFTARDTYTWTGRLTTNNALGTPVYLGSTAGQYTFTAPTSAAIEKQVVGYVSVSDPLGAATGAIKFVLPFQERSKVGGATTKLTVLGATSNLVDIYFVSGSLTNAP
jgi:hypothetical protein